MARAYRSWSRNMLSLREFHSPTACPSTDKTKTGEAYAVWQMTQRCRASTQAFRPCHRRHFRKSTCKQPATCGESNAIPRGADAAHPGRQVMDTQRNPGFSALVGADLPIDSFRAEAGNMVRLPPHQLQLAVADISRTLNEALRKNGINAMLYLRRTEDSLAPEVRPEILHTV